MKDIYTIFEKQPRPGKKRAGWEVGNGSIKTRRLGTKILNKGLK